MNSSWSDAGPLGGALTPRLGAALAVSAALHAGLGAALHAPFGPRWGGHEAGAARPICAALRLADPAPPTEDTLVAAATEAAPLAPDARAPRPETPAEARPAEERKDAPARAVLPESQYYRTRELDVRPGIMTRVEPEYPESAARRLLSGTVKLRLFLAETGLVERIEVVSADPPGHFEAAAERAFLAARFSPGMKNGRPVKVEMTLEIAFDSPPAPESRRR